MQENPEIRMVNSPAEWESVRRIRQQIFVDEQGIPRDVEDDGLNEEAIHVLASLDEEAIATARLVIMEDRQGEIARVAVVKAHRGKGLASLLLEELEKAAVNRQMRRLVLHPHHYLENFYSGLGYVLVPGSETQAGEHRLITMEKYLAEDE